MDFGIDLGRCNPRLWRDVARAADEQGYESVWIPEHLIFPVDIASSLVEGSGHATIDPRTPTFDPFVMLASMAAVTERIRLGTHVYNIGLRHPFVSARAVGTLDVVSNGRVEFGIGASWMKEEWDVVGLDFATRGARVDEAIEVCRRLWTEEEIEHHGRFFDFGRTAFEPKPVQQPIAMHIGGDGPAAIRRAATVGAGWIPMNHSLEELPASIELIHEMAAERGRTTPIEVTVVGSVSTPGELERYAEAGVTRVVVRPWTRSREALDAVSRFGDEVLSTLA